MAGARLLKISALKIRCLMFRRTMLIKLVGELKYDSDIIIKSYLNWYCSMRCLTTEKEVWGFCLGFFFFFFFPAPSVLMTLPDLIVSLVQLLEELGKGLPVTCHR